MVGWIAPYDPLVGADEADLLYDRWVGWFERISNETYTLFAYRDYWRGLAEMTQANGPIPASTFFDALGVWYAATQGTNVRRQLDRDSRAADRTPSGRRRSGAANRRRSAASQHRRRPR